MSQLSPTEAVGIAARYAAQIRELLMMNAAAADALREMETDGALTERATQELLHPSTAVIDLRI